MSTTAKFTWDQGAVKGLSKDMTKGLLRMGTAIASQARANAPVLTGALRNSIRVTTSSANTVYVLAGGAVAGKTVNYALYREYHNQKHPGTTHYMERAFDDVAKGDLRQYFKEIK